MTVSAINPSATTRAADVRDCAFHVIPLRVAMTSSNAAPTTILDRGIDIPGTVAGLQSARCIGLHTADRVRFPHAVSRVAPGIGGAGNDRSSSAIRFNAARLNAWASRAMSRSPSRSRRGTRRSSAATSSRRSCRRVSFELVFMGVATAYVVRYCTTVQIRTDPAVRQPYSVV